MILPPSVSYAPDLGRCRAYLAKWQPRMRLSDWDIWVEIGEVPAGAKAKIVSSWRDRTASIVFSATFHSQESNTTWDAFAQDHGFHEESTIVHELEHLWEKPLCDTFWPDLSDTQKEQFHHYQETVIEQMNRVLMAADRGDWAP